MTEILFYHLQGQKLENVLPTLLEKSLERGGTAFDLRGTDINKSWASGWGVRLLDRLVRDYYEG